MTDDIRGSTVSVAGNLTKSNTGDLTESISGGSAKSNVGDSAGSISAGLADSTSRGCGVELTDSDGCNRGSYSVTEADGETSELAGLTVTAALCPQFSRGEALSYNLG